MGIVLERLQLGHLRAGVGEGGADREADARGFHVQRGEAQGVADRLDKGDRGVTPSDEQVRAGGAQPLDRQPGKGQRQVATRYRR